MACIFSISLLFPISCMPLKLNIATEFVLVSIDFLIIIYSYSLLEVVGRDARFLLNYCNDFSPIKRSNLSEHRGVLYIYTVCINCIKSRLMVIFLNFSTPEAVAKELRIISVYTLSSHLYLLSSKRYFSLRSSNQHFASNSSVPKHVKYPVCLAPFL
jgi:hypothetical protein